MAFGEVLFDEHSVSKTQPYLFNSKELDYETGLYYYGARYYDPRTSIFLNVDPLVEKTGTPYAYVNNNPINLIDPTGMEGEGHWVGRNGELIYDDGINDNKLYYVDNNLSSNEIEQIKREGVLVSDNGMIKDISAFQKLVSAVANKIDIKTDIQFNIDSKNLQKKYIELEHFRTKGMETQILSNGIAGVFKAEEPYLQVNIVSSTNNETYKTYYNLINTLEHEKAHFNDINNLSTNSLNIPFNDTFHIRGKEIFRKRFERRAVEYQKSVNSWDKTTKKFKENVKNYIK